MARFDVTPPPGRGLSPPRGIGVALSPDGQRVVYVGEGPGGESQLWMRLLDDLEPAPIPGTIGAGSPVFSPDGLSLAFWVGREIRTVSLLGGPPLTVVDPEVVQSAYGDWGPDGRLYYTGRGGGFGSTIQRVPAAGGQPEPALTKIAWPYTVLPHVLPDGRGLLVTLRRQTPDSATIGVVGPEGEEIRELFTGTNAHYAASGHIVYVTVEGVLMAAPFDLSRLDVTGPSVALLQGIAVRIPGLGAHFALSETGTLVYRTKARDLYEAVWVDRSGAVDQIDPDRTSPLFSSLALSPEDDRLAVSLPQDIGWDIWIKQLETGPLSRVTFDGANYNNPSWSPDGEFVTFIGDQKTIRRAKANGTGEVATVLDVDALSGRRVYDAFFSPDGEWLVYRAFRPSRDILALRVGVDSVGRALLSEDYVEWSPALSHNGRWLAYASNETGQLEVYVRPFPDVNSAKHQVSSARGFSPVWSHSGRELFYRNGAGEMIAVDVIEDPTFSTGQQDVLFSAGDFLSNEAHPLYDVTADDRRFVMLRPSDSESSELILVQNFFEELKANVGR